MAATPGPLFNESAVTLAEAGTSSTSKVLLPDSAPPLYTDDEIIKQQNAIREEEAVKLQFVGDKEPLIILLEEYRGSAIFRSKIETLSATYGWIRRARGDGNCFYRSFMFAYLEHILLTRDITEVARVRQQVKECMKGLVALGYQEFTFEDFVEVFEEQLALVSPAPDKSEVINELVARCRDSSVSDYVVMLFRFITSGEIQRRAEMFAPFIFGMADMSVLQFCRSSVEPMGEESDHIHIQALTDALNVSVRVVYLDQSTGAAVADREQQQQTAAVNHYDFVPKQETETETASSVDDSSSPYLHLLYRPGHYDILYPKC